MKVSPIRTRRPDYDGWKNLPGKAQKVAETLKSVLGRLPAVPRGGRDMFEIGLLLYENGIRGTDYERIKAKWAGNPEFRMLEKNKDNFRLRRAIAETSAIYFYQIDLDPKISVAAKYIDIAMQGISRHLLPETVPDALLVGAGNTGCEWINRWPARGNLSLLDLNPYIADLLESNVAAFQRRDINVLEGDGFRLREEKKYNVVHAGDFLHYFDRERVAIFFRTLPRWFAADGEHLLVIQETASKDRFEWKADFKAEIGSIGRVVEETCQRMGAYNILTMFIK